MIWKLFGLKLSSRTFVVCAKAIAVTMLLLASTHPAPTSAQTSDIYRMAISEIDWYGNGVHEFNRGQYQASIRSMTTAIGLNDRDPRPYFFRGLASHGCGDLNAAHADFQMGAQMEAQRSQRPMREVNWALEKVQGYMRLEIESFRRDARLAMAYSNSPASSGAGGNTFIFSGAQPGSQPAQPPGSQPGTQPGQQPPNRFEVQPGAGQFTPGSLFPSGNTAPGMQSVPRNNPPTQMPAQPGFGQPSPVQPGGAAPNPSGDSPSPFGAVPGPDDARPAAGAPSNSPFGEAIPGGANPADANPNNPPADPVDNPFNSSTQPVPDGQVNSSPFGQPQNQPDSGTQTQFPGSFDEPVGGQPVSGDQPADTESSIEDQPFGNSDQPFDELDEPASEASDGPFGESTDAPFANPPQPDDSPFGESTGANDDAPAEPPTDDTPADDTPTDDNPFGG